MYTWQIPNSEVIAHLFPSPIHIFEKTTYGHVNFQPGAQTTGQKAPRHILVGRHPCLFCLAIITSFSLQALILSVLQVLVVWWPPTFLSVRALVAVFWRVKKGCGACLWLYHTVLSSFSKNTLITPWCSPALFVTQPSILAGAPGPLSERLYWVTSVLNVKSWRFVKVWIRGAWPLHMLQGTHIGSGSCVKC